MTNRFPTPDYHFNYRKAPVSGNTINGLGEMSQRRARQVFHGSGARKLEWSALETFLWADDAFANLHSKRSEPLGTAQS